MDCDRLTEVRLKKDMNKKEFAEYLGIKYTTYNNYETGTRDPGSDFLILVSQKCNVSIDYLMGLSDSSHSSVHCELTNDEVELIRKYRIIPEMTKRTITTIVNSFYDNELNMKELCFQSDKLVSAIDDFVKCDTSEIKLTNIESYSPNKQIKRMQLYLDKLSSIKDSQKADILNAAHEIPGASAADKKHDDDIMDDDNF